MKHSDDIRAELLRLVNAFQNRDLPAIEEMLSKQPGILSIGTDPAEWWVGHDKIIEIFTAQLEEMASYDFTLGRIAAFEEGSVGWAAADCTLTVEGTDPIPARLTLVSHREDAGWKLVFSQLSIAVPNEEAFGSPLTS